MSFNMQKYKLSYQEKYQQCHYSDQWNAKLSTHERITSVTTNIIDNQADLRNQCLGTPDKGSLKMIRKVH